MNTSMSLIEGANKSSGSFLDLYNKCNRLIGAVFVVLNLIDNLDQLKIRIKELSLKTTSLCVELKDVNGGAPNVVASNMERGVLELVSLLEVASISGVISQMNSSILRDEFQLFLNALSNYLREIEQSGASQVKKAFIQTDSLSPFSINHDSTPQSPKGELSKDNAKGHRRKDLRKDTIMEYLRTHNNASIKDILPNIRGCSEKTIQRELLDLVSLGRIQKQGERRWSRYSVA